MSRAVFSVCYNIYVTLGTYLAWEWSKAPIVRYTLGYYVSNSYIQNSYIIDNIYWHSCVLIKSSDSLHLFANDITNTVDVDVILPMMIQEDLVTLNQQQYLINPSRTPAEKQQKLCSIVIELPESCVEKFINILSETSNYKPHKILYKKLYEKL